jgi:amidase
MNVRHLALVLAVVSSMACTAASDQSTPQAPPVAAAPALDVAELSAADARARMDAGTLTARALTEAYLARIAALDQAGPALNAVIELNPTATAEAAALDAERAAGKVRGPMHGMPVLLKDNIDAVGMVNSAGSLALADNRPKSDAFVVARLRAAGAVILGKTNLSEWANFRSTRSSSGWSSRGGQTKHAYVLDRNPCGSSAGTGTAIAASLAAVGVGTETDGSILCPAAVSGLVGLKPTVGLVSRSGIIPISISQDTAGPMTRSVTDAAMLLTAMAGVDAADPSGTAATGKIPADYTALLTADALSPWRGRGDGHVPRHAEGRRRHGGRCARAHLQRLERRGIPSAALRVQGWAERLPEAERIAARVARGADRVEHGECRHRDAVLRSGDLRAGAGERTVDRGRVSEACWPRSMPASSTP